MRGDANRRGMAGNKHTTNVRKILTSQKTFANHLDDFEAVQQPAEQPPPPPPHTVPTAVLPPTAASDLSLDGAEGSTMLAPYPIDAQPADPLLQSRIPPVPTDAELTALLTARPLTYPEARAGWSGRYPVRVYCEMCGYWGRVKCMKCGTRVCALDCLEAHREECVTRYGL